MGGLASVAENTHWLRIGPRKPRPVLVPHGLTPTHGGCQGGEDQLAPAIKEPDTDSLSSAQQTAASASCISIEVFEFKELLSVALSCLLHILWR